MDGRARLMTDEEGVLHADWRDIKSHLISSTTY